MKIRLAVLELLHAYRWTDAQTDEEILTGTPEGCEHA
jgi:hypothetical protein